MRFKNQNPFFPMLGVFHRRALLCPNLNITIIRIPSFLQHFSSSSEQQHSFTINYLINNFGFSPATASILSARVRLDSSEKPDSLLALFRSHGFSIPQLSRIVRVRPQLLTSDLNKAILPKFDFLLSKGASSSDIVQIVTRDPRVLHHSLTKTIAPCYDFLKRYLLSDESTIEAVKSCTGLIISKHPANNIQMLLENGVPESKVPFLLGRWGYLLTNKYPSVFKTLEEVQELGFKPDTTVFIVALDTKIMKSSLWDRKTDLYKKWGWSDEMIVSAFVRYPWCMRASVDKIEAVMEFWVNQMGWESLLLAKHPILLMMSLENTVIPRSFVLQFLQSRGLVKDAKSSATPFKVNEKVFLQKFVNRFKEESAELLELYEEKKYRPR